MRETGNYKTLGEVRYFIPHALPPTRPPLLLNTEIMSLYGEASFRLGQLNEMSQRLPDLGRFIKAYVIKEALLSSAIEGIHTTLIDVFTRPLSEEKPNKNTQLVLNYTQALDLSLKMIKNEGLPLTSRVILKAHEVLMTAGEGDKASPGAYRKQAVSVGEHVPPPAPEVPHLMGELEKYINGPSDLPPLIKAGLAHVQFETIHPFLDGNGRIGRLLIVLMLIDGGLLETPILYPSYFFKKYHAEYYQRLDNVRVEGDFEGWITYYLRGIRDSALDAHLRAKEIEALEQQLQEFIQLDSKFARMRETAAVILNLLFSHPIVSISEMSERTGKAYNTVHHIIKQFKGFGWVSENTLHKRNKLYRFEPYLALLEKEYA